MGKVGAGKVSRLLLKAGVGVGLGHEVGKAGVVVV
jgi:hypothetical protein